MKGSLFKYIMDNISEKRFRNIGYLPRWIIFMIDVFIVFVASIITYFIVSSLTIDFYNHLNMPLRYALIIFINAFFFCFTGRMPESSGIRHLLIVSNFWFPRRLHFWY